MKQKHIYLSYISIIILIIVIVILLLKFGVLDKLDLTPKNIKETLSGFGTLAPLMLIVIQIFLAILPILPSPLISIAGGYLFGPFLGTIYSLIGMLIGSVSVFLISKKFGRKFVERFVDKRELHHFDIFFKKKGNLVFIFADYLSIFPRDTISLCAGITKISKLQFIVISIIGFVPGLVILTYFGSQLTSDMIDFRIILAGIIIIISVILYYFRHKIKGLLVKEIKVFEEEYNKNIN